MKTTLQISAFSFSCLLLCANIGFLSGCKPVAPPIAEDHPPRYEYIAIQWKEPNYDWDKKKKQTNYLKIQGEEDRICPDVDTILYNAGRLGWKLICYDGKNYIFEHPSGKSITRIEFIQKTEDLKDISEITR